METKTVDVKTVNAKNLASICVELSDADPVLACVFQTYGTPPLWARPEGYPTLLNIILEQQVSLASARACFDKLTERLGEVTPAAVLTLDDTEMKAIGFSRQKTAYARHLSESILDDRFDFDNLADLPDADVKAELVKLKGVGEWTSDIYLLMAMLRPDIMPKGDLALHAAFQRLTNAERRPTSDEFVVMAEQWKPFRSVAARLLWHYYLSEKVRQTS